MIHRRESLKGDEELVAAHGGVRTLRLLTVLGVSGILTGSVVAPASAQTEPSPAVVFVLDLSGSMNEGSPSRLTQAKDALRETVAALPDGMLVGLRVYGDLLASRPPAERQEGCETDTRLVFPVGPLDRDRFLAEVDGFVARGDTPIGLALSRAAGDIPEHAKGTIVLVSDGRDECYDADLNGDPDVGPSWGPAPCEVASELKAAGVGVSLERVETVGFHTDAVANAELRCIAEVTGGSFTPAADATELARKLIIITARAFRAPVRLGGMPVEGTPTIDGAPLIAAGEPSNGRYVDTIGAGERRHYQVEMARDIKANVTATVFDLPAQEGTGLSLHWLDADGEPVLRPQEKRDAGLDGAGSDSVRLPGIHWYGRGDLGQAATYYFAVELHPETPLSGRYDLELLLEGSALGGPALGCPEGSVCAYEATISALEIALAEVEDEHAVCCEGSAGEEHLVQLTVQRDELATVVTALQDSHDGRRDLGPALALAALAVVGIATRVLASRWHPKPEPPASPHDEGGLKWTDRSVGS